MLLEVSAIAIGISKSKNQTHFIGKLIEILSKRKRKPDHHHHQK
jgi:hypothetical protein